MKEPSATDRLLDWGYSIQPCPTGYMIVSLADGALVGKVIKDGDEWTSGGSVYSEPEEAALAYVESEAVIRMVGHPWFCEQPFYGFWPDSD